MILGDRNAASFERVRSAGPVQPGRRNETRDRSPEDVLQQRAAVPDPPLGLFPAEPEELALARSHEAATETVSHTRWSRIRRMEVSVEEDLDARVRPTPEPACEYRAWQNWRVVPMIRHDQHRKPVIRHRSEPVGKGVDCTLETRRNVVDREEHDTALFG